MEKYKRKCGDKKDGRLIKGEELDTNHFVMPLLWPNRCDNEAFISQTFDLTNAIKYLEKKNEGEHDFVYSTFMLLAAAYGKAIINRPKMNRFYRNGRLYERYDVTIGFIVKKSLRDDAEEGLARVYVEPCDTFETLAAKINREIEERRSEVMDKSSDELRVLMKFPHFIGKMVMGFMKLIDKKTSVPKSVSASDMSFTSLIFSVLGSIGLPAGYHHLANWGTNSFFTTIGEKKPRPFVNNDGSVTVKQSIDVGMTIDERIADGLYFSRTIKLLKKYIENPELLDQPFKDE